MPKGVYPRKNPKAAATAPAEPQPITPKARKARIKSTAAAKPAAAQPRRPSPDTGAVFGVFEDGSVVINGPDCKGTLDHKLADRLVAFIAKLKRK